MAEKLEQVAMEPRAKKPKEGEEESPAQGGAPPPCTVAAAAAASAAGAASSRDCEQPDFLHVKFETEHHTQSHRELLELEAEAQLPNLPCETRSGSMLRGHITNQAHIILVRKYGRLWVDDPRCSLSAKQRFMNAKREQ